MIVLREMSASLTPKNLHFAALPELMPDNNMEFGGFVTSELSMEEAPSCGFDLCLSGLCAVQGTARMIFVDRGHRFCFKD
jgi:hypothetical protein